MTSRHAARSRSYADTITHEDVLDATEAVQCWLAAADEHDRVMPMVPPSDREPIEKRKVYGDAAA